MKAFNAEIKPVAQSDTQITLVFAGPRQAIEYAIELLGRANDALSAGGEVGAPVAMCTLVETD